MAEAEDCVPVCVCVCVLTAFPSSKYTILPSGYTICGRDCVTLAENPPPPVGPPPPIRAQVALAPEPDILYPALQLAAPQVGNELKLAAFATALQRLVHWVTVDGVTVYVPEAAGAVAKDVPGVEFSEHASVVLPFLKWIDFTALSDEPTLNVPGLATVNAPLENVQLSAVEPFKMSMFAVVKSNVTDETVMLPSAVKSVVAASASAGKNNKRSAKRCFFTRRKRLHKSQM